MKYDKSKSLDILSKIKTQNDRMVDEFTFDEILDSNKFPEFHQSIKNIISNMLLTEIDNEKYFYRLIPKGVLYKSIYDKIIESIKCHCNLLDYMKINKQPVHIATNPNEKEYTIKTRELLIVTDIYRNSDIDNEEHYYRLIPNGALFRKNGYFITNEHIKISSDVSKNQPIVLLPKVENTDQLKGIHSKIPDLSFKIEIEYLLEYQKDLLIKLIFLFKSILENMKDDSVGFIDYFILNRFIENN